MEVGNKDHNETPHEQRDKKVRLHPNIFDDFQVNLPPLIDNA